jgi:hypothetical protein
LNRRFLEKDIIGFPGIAGSGVSAGERAVEALLNETLYVNVDLRVSWLLSNSKRTSLYLLTEGNLGSFVLSACTGRFS